MLFYIDPLKEVGYGKGKDEEDGHNHLPTILHRVALFLGIVFSIIGLITLLCGCQTIRIITSDITTKLGLGQQEDRQEQLNMRPIIGLLSQEIPEVFMKDVPKDSGYTSYIAASFVKNIESAGARVAPVPTGKDYQFYAEMFWRINGLMLPGGMVSASDSEYQRIAQIFYTLAIEANNRGEVFPIWGTCLGFQTLVVISTGYQPVVTRCESYVQNVPLELGEDWKKSRLFGKAPSSIMRYLTRLPIVLNFHHDCVSMDNFNKFNMSAFWLALSHNTDFQGEVFIGTLEARKFPFFATQWHPEKNPYEWDPAWKINGSGHSREAVRMSFYFAEFFVDLARHSNHTFPNKTSEEDALIYNNQIFYMGRKKETYFEQIYML